MERAEYILDVTRPVDLNKCPYCKVVIETIVLQQPGKLGWRCYKCNWSQDFEVDVTHWIAYSKFVCSKILLNNS